MSRVCFFLLVMFSCAVAHAAAVTPLAAPCVAGPTSLCLNSQRFKLEVRWTDFEGNTGVGTAVPLTSDTGYFWFFSSSNVELVVKVLDGRPLNGHFWIFYGALSNVQYTMSVTDSQTGSVKTYTNPAGRFASVGDTDAFSAAGKANWTPDAAFERTGENAHPELSSALLRTAAGNALSTCVGTETSLCLNGGRFRAEVKWKDFDGNTGVGKAVALTSDTGYFWFFSDSNVELVVKALDARGLNGRFWVFYGALSNVEYEMTVTDTLTGNVNTYSNPAGRFASAGDTDGFRSGYSVAAQLDETRSVSQEISTTGGSISATAADGTVFTITVPGGALLSDEEITMTPVAAIDRLPLSGGLVAAVQLGPEGLRLFKPATLTINPRMPIPIDEEMTFALRGSGEEFFLYPPVPLNTAAISMTVSHLSTYGAGRGTGADEAAQQQRPPANGDDQYKQNLQDPAAAQRKELRHGVGGSFAAKPSRALIDAAIKVLTNYFLNVLGPKQPLKCSDDWKGFLSKLKGFEEDVNNEGDSDPTLLRATQAYYESVYQLLFKCYDEAYGRCKSDNDPSQGEEMARIYAALNANGQGSRVDRPKIGKCLTFELTFNSSIQEKQYAPNFAFRHKVSAIVPLITFYPFLEPQTVSAELKYETADYTGSVDPDSKCSLVTSGSPSVFQVFKLSIDINVFDGNGPPPNPLTMKYDPGHPDFTFRLACGSAPVQTLTSPRWREIYEPHRGDFSGTFLAKDWDKPSIKGAFYAFKTYQPDDALGKEFTKMDLKHTPQ